MSARFHAARVGQGMCVVTGEHEARAESADDLREALSAAVAAGCKRVLVDLQETESIDPLILGAILGSQRRLTRFEGEMAVTCGSPSGYADLERAALPRLMTAFEDRQEAYDWLGVTVQETPGNAR